MGLYRIDCFSRKRQSRQSNFQWKFNLSKNVEVEKLQVLIGNQVSMFRTMTEKEAGAEGYEWLYGISSKTSLLCLEVA